MNKKAKNLFLIFALLLLLILLLSYLSYCIYVTYIKQNCLKNLLVEIKKEVTKCYIQKDKENRYKNDYYITLGERHNRSSHIHLVTNIHDLNYVLIPNTSIGYIFKNNNIRLNSTRDSTIGAYIF